MAANSENNDQTELQAKMLAVEAKMKANAVQFRLDPALDEYAKQYIKKSLAANTLRAYKEDIQLFRHWCENREVPYLPASPATVANFLAAQGVQQTPYLKMSTIRRRAAAIRYLHKMADVEMIPTNSEVVKKTIAGIMREKLVAPHKKASATDDLIHRMVDQIDTSTLIGKRDRALILFGFAGAFRRSELISLKMEDLEAHPKGLRAMIRKSKTDQTGKGRIKPIIKGSQYCPVQALTDWIQAAGIKEGYVFRRLHKSGIALSHNQPETPELTSQVVAFVVKKYALLIGLDANLFAGHSLRRGFITSGVRKGKKIEKLVEITHQTLQTLMNYYEDIHQFENHAGEGLL